jgi:hypothetical protein
VAKNKLSDIAKRFLREAIEIRKDWFNVTDKLELYLVGDSIREKQTNLDSLSDDAYAEVVMQDDAFTGEFEKELRSWITKAIKTNRFPEYIDESMPKEDWKKFASELYDIIENSFIDKEREHFEGGEV